METELLQWTALPAGWWSTFSELRVLEKCERSSWKWWNLAPFEAKGIGTLSLTTDILPSPSELLAPTAVRQTLSDERQTDRSVWR